MYYLGENFSGETGGLFEEPPVLTQAAIDNVGPLDPLSPQKNGMH